MLSHDTFSFKFTLVKITYVESNGRLIMNDGLERTWEEVVVAYFLVHSQHFPRMSEKNSWKSSG
jgi:hypothetical protein